MRRVVVVLFASVAVALLTGAVQPAAAGAAWGQPNGCGSGGWVNDVLGADPYNARFTPACDLHDWCYGGAARPVSVGAVGDWLSRRRCDDLFYGRMLQTCRSDTACRLSAADYYAAVRTFGDSILFGHPYTSGQRDGQRNLLPNPAATGCTGCSAGVSAPTVHVDVLGSNTTYWKLDAGGWHRIGCEPWDPYHVSCRADVPLQLTTGGAHVFRVKAVDTYTGVNGHTWPAVAWTS
jgi:hypothetical protein